MSLRKFCHYYGVTRREGEGGRSRREGGEVVGGGGRRRIREREMVCVLINS